MSEAGNTAIAVEIRGLSKINGGERVLSDINMSVSRKGVHGILGPKGAGKSDLLDAIACTGSFDEGEIELLGQNIDGAFAISAKKEELYGLKKRIGYVRGEDGFYPDMTASELLFFVGETKKVNSGKLARQIKEALSLVGLDDYGDVLVKNLNSFQRRLLGIASALLGNPDLILIDEPYYTNVGDTKEKRDHLQGIITMLGKIKTVIVATRDFDMAKALCSDVVILSGGKVLACGSFEELETRLKNKGEGTLRELYKTLESAASDSELLSENGGED